MSSGELFSRFGEVEKVYRPSAGQTVVGVFLATLAAVGAFAVAAFGCGFDVTNRVCAVVLGVMASAFAVWLYRQRRWRLVIFADGLVQVRAGGVDELLWSDVREVVQTRTKGFGESVVRVTVVGSAARVVVSPVNYHSRAKLFETLIAAAERRGIPVRVEWEEPD